VAERKEASYDVIVVGSGASGGWAAKQLSEAGLKVALLEAGKPQSDSNFTEHEPNFKYKYRNQAWNLYARRRPIQAGSLHESTQDWLADDLLEPYTTAPGMPFRWIARTRIVGGRTNMWGRHSYRLSDLDFKAASHDGYGEDWPLSYRDLEPYYDRVESYVGVCGTAEGLPQLPDGKFQPAMPLTCAEQRVRERAKQKLGWTLTMGRLANLTRPLNGRAACHYCGPCWRGCVTHSYFNSYFTTVADAIASGNCTLVTNAMVYQVLMDPDRNRARGVLYIDRVTREPREVRARVVVLAAQASESVRILLNSANSQYPNGLANSSGALGHYFMDHIYMGGGAYGEFPDLPVKPIIDGPNRPGGTYTPRFQNLAGAPRAKKFIRGFGFQTWDDDPHPAFRAPGFGDAYKKAVMAEQAPTILLRGFGECLARWENYVELDPEVRDTYGIPVLRFHMQYGENEHALIDEMATSAATILEAAGAKNILPYTVHDREPGLGIHEVGVARMGDDPHKSVLNAFQQSHDVKNLFVCDGAGFTSTACQNPTLTIMTLCVRSMDYLMGEMKRGNV
jgi:glucoside 3-dehydrogenase (cytochrome c) catalytic subunit